MASVGIAALLTSSALAAQLDGALQQSHQDEIPAPLSAVEEYWQNPVAPVVFTGRQPITADDEISVTLPIQDEDFWQPPLQQQWPQPLKLLWSIEEDIVPTPTIVDETDQPVIVVIAPQTTTTLLWLLDDSPPFQLEEEYWLRFQKVTQESNFLFLPTGDEEVVVVPVPVDEDFWSAPVLQPLGQPPIQPLVADDEITQAAIVDEDYQWTPTIQIPGPLVLPVLADDEVTAFVVDEEYWQNPLVQPPIPIVLPVLADDEIMLLPFDEEPWTNWVLPVTGWPYQILPIWLGAEDEVPLPAPPLPVEDEYWLQLVAPAVGYLRVSLPVNLGMDEEITQTISVQEDYWLHDTIIYRPYCDLILPLWIYEQGEIVEQPQLNVEEDYKLPVILTRIDHRWPNPWYEIDEPPLSTPAVVVVFPTPPGLIRRFRRTRRSFNVDE